MPGSLQKNPTKLASGQEALSLNMLGGGLLAAAGGEAAGSLHQGPGPVVAGSQESALQATELGLAHCICTSKA